MTEGRREEIVQAVVTAVIIGLCTIAIQTTANLITDSIIRKRQEAKEERDRNRV